MLPNRLAGETPALPGIRGKAEGCSQAAEGWRLWVEGFWRSLFLFMSPCMARQIVSTGRQIVSTPRAIFDVGDSRRREGRWRRWEGRVR
jgi:hypothetical protein